MWSTNTDNSTSTTLATVGGNAAVDTPTRLDLKQALEILVGVRSCRLGGPAAGRCDLEVVRRVVVYRWAFESRVERSVGDREVAEEGPVWACGCGRGLGQSC